MYNFIPDDIQDELLALRDQMTNAQFRVGDIVLMIRDALPEIDVMQIYSAVGHFVGRAGRTVREYAMVAEYYAPAIRERFDVLAFDHFRVALRFGNKSYDALQWAAENAATVDAMEAYAEPVSDNAVEYAERENPISQIKGAADRLLRLITENAPLIDGDLANSLILAISRLQNALK